MDRLKAGMIGTLPVILIAITALTAFESATVSWDPNTEPDLAGYKIYYGSAPGVYEEAILVGNVTSYRVTELVAGKKYHFVVTAFDFTGNESGFSAEVTHTVAGPIFAGPPVPVVGWRDTPGDTNHIVIDTTATDMVELNMQLSWDRPLGMILDSLQIDLRLVQTAWPIVGVVYFTRSISGGWVSISGPIEGLFFGLHYAVNARVKEAGGQWGDWPGSHKFFKVAIKAGAVIISEVFSITVSLKMVR